MSNTWKDGYQQGYTDAIEDAILVFRTEQDFEVEVQYLAMIIADKIINHESE